MFEYSPHKNHITLEVTVFKSTVDIGCWITKSTILSLYSTVPEYAVRILCVAPQLTMFEMDVKEFTVDDFSCKDC
jgi:hypothetical protein